MGAKKSLRRKATPVAHGGKFGGPAAPPPEKVTPQSGGGRIADRPR